MKKKILIGLLSMVLLLTGCGNNSKSTPPESKETKTPAVTNTSPPPQNLIQSLQLTPDQFKWSFNEVALQNGLSELSIGDIAVKVGDKQDVGQFNFSSNLIFQCAIDKSSGLVKEVWLLSKPSTTEELFAAVVVYSMFIAVLNPELTPDQRGDVLIAVKLMPDKIAQLDSGRFMTVRGNVRYTAGKIDKSTFMLVASAKDL